MMKVIADYHTHTIYSHGVGTIEENVISAINKGLKTIAISDHGSGNLEYGMKKSDYKVMRENIDRLKEKYYGKIDILLGIEANILDVKGNLDIDEDVFRYKDIILAGFHFDIVYKELLMPIRLNKNRHESLKALLEENLYKEIEEINTVAIIKSINTYPIDIITHPGNNYPINISKLSEIAGNKNVALEINNFHRCLSVSQIKKAMIYEKLNFVISSDAHRPVDVGNFIGALKILKESGLDIKRVKNIELDKTSNWLKNKDKENQI